MCDTILATTASRRPAKNPTTITRCRMTTRHPLSWVAKSVSLSTKWLSTGHTPTHPHNLASSRARASTPSQLPAFEPRTTCTRDPFPTLRRTCKSSPWEPRRSDSMVTWRLQWLRAVSLSRIRSRRGPTTSLLPRQSTRPTRALFRVQVPTSQTRPCMSLKAPAADDMSVARPPRRAWPVEDGKQK